MSNTYLLVPFAQKDRAKALGARWDSAMRQWYVPAGVDVSGFQEWLPAAPAGRVSAQTELVPAGAAPVLAGPRSLSLSQLLGGVAKAVADAFEQGVWTRAEVLRVQAKDGHVYLELTERDEQGRVLAKAPAAIWARTAAKILPDFERVTGAHLAAGIKLLVLAKPVFRAQFGFSLEISAIDPAFTVGDLEAQKRRIRERLQAEKLFGRNRQLSAPWDYSAVLVVAPEGAAGLGDFRADADRLHQHRLCDFTYTHSRFQGPEAASEILDALQRTLASAATRSFDAVIIIRGGGAVNDLAWLNDYELAKFICTCPIPVLTGIGHERDSTILDEVAHTSFDTPSKVVAGIEKQIVMRAREAREAYDRVLSGAARQADRTRMLTERLDTEIRTSARDTVREAHRASDALVGTLRVNALRQVDKGAGSSEILVREVQGAALQHIRMARDQVPAALASVSALSVSRLREVRTEVNMAFPGLIAQAAAAAGRARQDLQHARNSLMERAQQTVAKAHTGAESLMREVAGLGPEKTLARGFAMVSTPDGNTVTSAAAAAVTGNILVSFSDGQVRADVKADTKGEKK